MAIPEILGDISTLYNVAVAKAMRKANASSRGFHQPTYDGALPEYISVLIAEAQNGRLQVCNQFGLRVMPTQIISDVKLKNRIEEYESDENLIIALNVYVNLHQLNVWAKEQGDVFCKKHEWVPYIDERGWNNFEVEPPSLKVEFKLETRPIQKQASQVAPVGVVGPSGGMEFADEPGWRLKTTLKVYPGYRLPLYQFLKNAHSAKQPYPKAQNVMDAWAKNPVDGVKVIKDEIEFELETGQKKKADVKSLQAAIKNMTEKSK